MKIAYWTYFYDDRGDDRIVPCIRAPHDGGIYEVASVALLRQMLSEMHMSSRLMMRDEL